MTFEMAVQMLEVGKKSDERSRQGPNYVGSYGPFMANFMIFYFVHL